MQWKELSPGASVNNRINNRGICPGLRGLSGLKRRRSCTNKDKSVTLVGFFMHPASYTLAPTFTVVTDVEFRWARSRMFVTFFSRWHLEVNKTHHSKDKHLNISYSVGFRGERMGLKTRPTFARETELKSQPPLYYQWPVKHWDPDFINKQNYYLLMKTAFRGKVIWVI